MFYTIEKDVMVFYLINDLKTSNDILFNKFELTPGSKIPSFLPVNT